MRIAFAGNPNSGKTTMYNALTGRNEKVGNWAATPSATIWLSASSCNFPGETAPPSV